MSYLTKESIVNRLNEHKERAIREHDVLAVFLQGSQNYTKTLYDRDSDVDSVAIVMPTFEDLILRKNRINKNITMNNGEIINVKDIRDIVHLLFKSNINTLEILYTPYYVVNPTYARFIEKFKNQFIKDLSITPTLRLSNIPERIVRQDEKRLYDSIKGMSYRSYKKFKQSVNEDNLYRFEGKALAHVIRLRDTLYYLDEQKPFNECLVSTSAEIQHRLKREDYYNVFEAIDLADNAINDILQIYDARNKQPFNRNKDIRDLVEHQLIRFIKEFYNTFER